MNAAATFARVRKVILEELVPIDDLQITAESRLAEDLGADSLDRVELVLGLEEEFGIEIPDEIARVCHTVGDVVQALEMLATGKKPEVGSRKSERSAPPPTSDFPPPTSHFPRP